MTRKHVHDPRPYIRDAAGLDEPPSAGFVATATIGMVALALAVCALGGALIGAALPVPRTLLAANAEGK